MNRRKAIRQRPLFRDRGLRKLIRMKVASEASVGTLDLTSGSRARQIEQRIGCGQPTTRHPNHQHPERIQKQQQPNESRHRQLTAGQQRIERVRFFEPRENHSLVWLQRRNMWWKTDRDQLLTDPFAQPFRGKRLRFDVLPNAGIRSKRFDQKTTRQRLTQMKLRGSASSQQVADLCLLARRCMRSNIKRQHKSDGKLKSEHAFCRLDFQQAAMAPGCVLIDQSGNLERAWQALYSHDRGGV